MGCICTPSVGILHPLSFPNKFLPCLLQVLLKECLNLVKWYHIHLVVQISMHRIWHDVKFLVVTSKFFESILTIIARMRLFAVQHQNGRVYLIRISE